MINKIAKNILKYYKQEDKFLQFQLIFYSCCILWKTYLKIIKKNENIQETIENYKIQLGKHHKVIINDGKPEGFFYNPRQWIN